MSTDLLSAHEVAARLGVTKARVHQLATETGADGQPILPPAVEKRSPKGKITMRLWDRDIVRELAELREVLPPQNRGPVGWDIEAARAEAAAQQS